MRKSFRRPHRIKRKKPILRRRFFWLGILIFLVFSTAFYLLFFSRNFQVEKIIVTGEEKVTGEELKTLIEGKLENKLLFFKTRSIFLVDLKGIREDILNSFPQIAEVEVGRGLPDALNLVVVERLSLAVWCQEDKCFLLDNEGVIFKEAFPELDLTKIVDRRNTGSFNLAEKVIEKDLLSQIFEIKSKLRENLKILIREASIISDERLNVKVSEGWQIYFNLKGDLDWQITELSLVLEKQIPPEKREELEYIDLRFNRVYYK